MQNRLNLIIIMKENTFKYFVMLPQEFAVGLSVEKLEWKTKSL